MSLMETSGRAGAEGGNGAVFRFVGEEERRALMQRSTWRALAWFIPDYAAWIAFTIGAIAPLPWPVCLIFAILSGTAIGIVFTVGHDAAHQAATPHRWLNKVIAHLAFIPSAHSVSLWELGHNGIHHGRTNLLGRDYVWAPITPAQYRARPLWHRLLYRLYRSGWGHLPYHLIGMWWSKYFLPIAPEARGEWRRHLPDSLFVLAGQALWIWGVLAGGAALAPDRPWWATLALGWLVPFLFWNWLVGVIIYMHHTHPAVGWFGRREEWSVYRAQVMSTVEALMPPGLALVDNNIMHHTAHHLFPAIPMYNLKRAQRRLRQAFPGVTALVMTPRSVAAVVRACKLFDPEARCWRDFDGRATSPPIPLPPMHAPASGAGTE